MQFIKFKDLKQGDSLFYISGFRPEILRLKIKNFRGHYSLHTCLVEYYFAEADLVERMEASEEQKHRIQDLPTRKLALPRDNSSALVINKQPLVICTTHEELERFSKGKAKI